MTKFAEFLFHALRPDGQSLKDTLTPDGPTFEEWLTSKNREEDGKNDGSP